MNNRIRELALQAGIDFLECTNPEHGGREYCEAWTEQQQKFAELIVLECSRHIEDNFDFCGDEIIIAESVLKHFGIEVEEVNYEQDS